MNAKISEIFYSLQLEGSFIGYPAIFIRFSGCNLNCDFCDTKYALDEGIKKNKEEIYEQIKRFNTKRIIFTGGEPALYDDFMADFMKTYYDYEYFIETNGTIFIEQSIKKLKHIVVSPKFFAIDEDVLNLFNKHSNSVEFKFIIDNEDDIKQTERLTDKLKLKNITLQPLFDNDKPIEQYIKKTAKIIELFKKSNLTNKNARLIIQNQKIIYNQQRGV